MSTISSPDTTTTTKAAQRINLPESQIHYTLRNTGSESVWWHSNLDIADASIANKTAAQLRTAGCSELKTGETNTIFAHNTWIKAVYPSDGGASTLDIEPGFLSPDTILQAGDLEIGAVEIKDADSTARANVKAANTARTTATVVLAVQNVDAAGKVLNVGTGVMAASAPATIATDDTQFGAVGAAADPDGNVHGQLRSIAENTDTLEALLAKGTGAMAASHSTTLATDDTQFGAVGAAADVDGNVHGQLRYAGEQLETNTAGMTTKLGTTGGAADANGGITEQLRYLAETIGDAVKADLNELTAAPVKKTFTVFVKTATSGSQAALVASETFCRAFSIQAKKVGGPNTGNVFIGAAAVSVGDAEVFELTPDSVMTPPIPAGVKIDLNEIFIDVDTTGDGIVGWYIPV